MYVLGFQSCQHKRPPKRPPSRKGTDGLLLHAVVPANAAVVKRIRAAPTPTPTHEVVVKHNQPAGCHCVCFPVLYCFFHSYSWLTGRCCRPRRWSWYGVHLQVGFVDRGTPRHLHQRVWRFGDWRVADWVVAGEWRVWLCDRGGGNLEFKPAPKPARERVEW